MTRSTSTGSSEPVTCRTPTPGRQATRIAAWKFDAVRNVVLELLPPWGTSEGLPFRDLSDAVAVRLPADVRARLGSVSWHVTTVKLELECRGEVRRSQGSPQQLWRVPGRGAVGRRRTRGLKPAT